MPFTKAQHAISRLFGGSAGTVGDDLEVRMLAELSRAVGSSLEGPDTAHQLITESVTSILNVERSILFVPEDNQFRAAAASGVVAPEDVKGWSIPLDAGVLGHVYASGDPMLIPDAMNPPFPLTDLVEKLQVRSIVAVPLKIQNEVIGIIVADTPRGGRSFSREDLRLLEVFGGFAALVSSEAKLIDELRTKNEKLESLFEISRQLNSQASPAVVLHTVLQSAIHLTGASSGSLVFVDPDKHELIIRASEGLPNDVSETLKLGIGQGVTGWVADKGRSARIDDVGEDERYVEAKGAVRSELAVPIMTGEVVIGVLNVDSDTVGAFTEQHQSYLEALADLAATKVQFAFLEERNVSEDSDS